MKLLTNTIIVIILITIMAIGFACENNVAPPPKTAITEGLYVIEDDHIVLVQRKMDFCLI